MSESVTYICKRTVVSTKPVPPGKYFPSSVLARLMEKNHLRMVFYYPAFHGGDQAILEAGHVTLRLRECLSEMLTHFPAVTGRLKRDDEGRWTVKCNDAGVRMVEARAKGSVEDWLNCVDRDKELKLVHWEDMYHKPYFWSTFYVQLTEFEDGGFAIGLSCIHLLADPICATVFLNAWAQQTFYGKMVASYFHPLPQRKPINNKALDHIPCTSLINHYKSTIQKSVSIPIVDTNYTTVSLAFSDPMVRACIDKAQIIDSASEKSPLAFQALAGLFWVCISKVKGVTDGLVDMSVCLDMRGVLGVDKRFFGSCMVYNSVNSGGFQQNDVSEAAKAVGQVAGKMDNEGILDLIDWLEQNDDGSLPLMNGSDLVCASLGHAEPYLAEFGDGVAPIRVSYYVEPVLGLGQVLILPGPPGEGPLSRVVMVTLPREELAKLCDDELMLSFSPTLLMGLDSHQ